MPVLTTLALLLFAACSRGDAPPDPASERAKGAGQVEVLVEGRGWFGAGDHLHPGDRLQVRVPPGPSGEVWLGDGQRVLGSFRVAAARATLSPFALEVDDGPGDELLVVVRSPVAIQATTARAAMRADSKGGGLDGVEVTRLHLPKQREGDEWGSSPH